MDLLTHFSNTALEEKTPAGSLLSNNSHTNAVLARKNISVFLLLTGSLILFLALVCVLQHRH